MDRHDIKKAGSALSALESAEQNLEALRLYDVTSITVDRGEGGLSPITLEKGRSGTGSVNGVGYSDGMKFAMTKALKDYLVSEVETAKGELAKYGVSAAA